MKTNSTGANTDSGGSFGHLGRAGLRRVLLQHQRRQVAHPGQCLRGHRRRLPGRRQEGHGRPLLADHQVPAGRLADQRAARDQPHDPDRQNRHQEPRLRGSQHPARRLQCPRHLRPVAPTAVQAVRQGTGASITWTRARRPTPPATGSSGRIRGHVLHPDRHHPAGVTSFADIGLAMPRTTGSRSSPATGATTTPSRRCGVVHHRAGDAHHARCATRTARRRLRPSRPGRSW